MSRPESEYQPSFQIAREEEITPAQLKAVPLSLRKQSIAQFDQDLRNEKLEREQKELQALSAKSPEVAAGLAQGQTLFNDQEFALAANIFRSVLKLDPQNQSAIRGVAECERALGQHELAIQELKRLVKTHQTPENYLLLADQLSALNYFEDALQAYFSALSSTVHEGAELFEIYKNIGNVLLKLGDADGAEEYYNRAYTLFPDSDSLLVNFGSLALYRGDLQKALIRFREAVQINDANDKGWIGLAMIHREHGDIELAWANIEKALDHNAGNESGVKLATEWALKDNEIDKAIRRLSDYLECNQKDSQAFLWLSKFLYLAGHLPSAYEKIRFALHLNPEVDGGLEVLKVIKEEMMAKGIEIK